MMNKKNNVRLKDITMSLRQGKLSALPESKETASWNWKKMFLGLRAIERGLAFCATSPIQSVDTAGRRASGMAHILQTFQARLNLKFHSGKEI